MNTQTLPYFESPICLAPWHAGMNILCYILSHKYLPSLLPICLSNLLLRPGLPGGRCMTNGHSMCHVNLTYPYYYLSKRVIVLRVIDSTQTRGALPVRSASSIFRRASPSSLSARLCSVTKNRSRHRSRKCGRSMGISSYLKISLIRYPMLHRSGPKETLVTNTLVQKKK